MFVDRARRILSWVESLLPPEDIEPENSVEPVDRVHAYGLAAIHDQEDELNRQQSLLLARFYDNLFSLGMPQALTEELVRMRFSRMLFSDQSSLYEYQDDED